MRRERRQRLLILRSRSGTGRYVCIRAHPCKAVALVPRYTTAQKDLTSSIPVMDFGMDRVRRTYLSLVA